jgi:hypothetical protein
MRVMPVAVTPAVPEEWELLIDAVNGLNSGDGLTRLFALGFFVWLIGPALLPLVIGLAQGHPFAGALASVLSAVGSVLSLPLAVVAYDVIGETAARVLVAMPGIIAIGATVIMERSLVRSRKPTSH